MAVWKVHSERRCKFCMSEHRDEIDRMLELREKKAVDPATGIRMTQSIFFKRCLELGIPTPNLDNIRSHWKRHSKSVSATDASFREAKLHETATRIKGPKGVGINVDAVLDTIIRAGTIDLELKIAQTGKSGVTVDHLIKAVQAKTARRSDEARTQLLAALTQGVESHFQLDPVKPDLELVAAEVVEVAEIVQPEEARDEIRDPRAQAAAR